MYRKYFNMQLKSNLEYRMNMLLLIITQTFTTAAEIIAVYLMFARFETVGGWGFYDSLLMFGIMIIIFSVVECFARGYDEFGSLIKHGDLDRMLVRPVGLHKQIFGSKIEFFKLGRVLLGIIVLIIALAKLNIAWTVWKVAVLVATLVCGIFMIFGLFLVNATVCIFSVDNTEFINIITYGSKELAHYPLDIYNKWLRRIFTFIIPVACFNYLPVSFLLGKGSVPMWLCGVSPLFGLIFFLPCLLLFNISLKKYQSTGT